MNYQENLTDVANSKEVSGSPGLTENKTKLNEGSASRRAPRCDCLMGPQQARWDGTPLMFLAQC